MWEGIFEPHAAVVINLHETDFSKCGLNYSPDKRRTTSCCFPKVRLHPRPQHTSGSSLLLPSEARAIRGCLVSPRAVRFSSGLDRLDWLGKPQTLSPEEGSSAFLWNRKAFFGGSDKITALLSCRRRSDFPRNRRSQAPALLAVGSLLRIRL